MLWTNETQSSWPRPCHRDLHSLQNTNGKSQHLFAGQQHLLQFRPCFDAT